MRLISTFGDALPLVVAAFLAAALLSLLLTPVARRFAWRSGTVDQPNHRRVNKRPIPRGGGIAVAAAFVPVAGVALLLNEQFDLLPDSFSLDPGEVVALLLGGVVATAIGVFDDALQLRARWQLLGQLAVAAFAVACGITVTFLANPLGTGNVILAGPFAVGFTVLWIVGMINSINFIDGLDGLSSGIALIAAVTLGLISLTTAVAQPLVAVLCFALAGSLLGFLRWNFHPASIFIGTSGVMFVGYTLALLSILGSAKVAVALLVLGVPIIDTFWIIVRRLATGRSPFTPDRGHIHHRLLDLGLTHGQTVLVIYAICVALAVLSFVLSGTGQVYAFLGIGFGFGLALFLLTRGESGDALEADAYESGVPAPATAAGPAADQPEGDPLPAGARPAAGRADETRIAGVARPATPNAGKGSTPG
jgi:UDP-GlcNAc:undecaprenyl-phosphate GlcNAc-1-phosphate transferase